MKYLKKIIKIILKKFLIFLIIIYAPLPFSNIFSFYNDLNDNNDFEYGWKDKLKIVLIGVGLICIFYILLKNGGNTPDSILPNGNSASSVKIQQQQQIMQKRLDNALSVTQRILEIKKNKS